jgi:hypothetical protein
MTYNPLVMSKVHQENPASCLESTFDIYCRSPGYGVTFKLDAILGSQAIDDCASTLHWTIFIETWRSCRL